MSEPQIYYEDIDRLQEDALSLWRGFHKQIESVKRTLPQDQQQATAMQQVLAAMDNVSQGFHKIVYGLAEVKEFFPTEPPSEIPPF